MKGNGGYLVQNSIRTAALVSVLLGFVFTGHGQDKDPPAMVHGRVINVVGLPIPNAEVIFESQFEFYRTKTDSKGIFNIELVPTVYRMTTDAWVGQLDYPKDELLYSKKCRSYFRESRRGNFRLVPKQSLEINLVLAEVDCVFDWDGKPRSDRYGPFGNPTDIGRAPRTRYETLYYPKYEFKDDQDLVIQFGDREIKEGVVTYLPATGYRIFNKEPFPYVFGFPFPGVIITYNNMTFYVEEAKFNPKRGRLEATKGKIVAEDGTKRYGLKKLVITIVNDKVEIKSS